MDKLIYVGAVALLFVIITIGMWFFPVNRDLKADKEFLNQPTILK